MKAVVGLGNPGRQYEGTPHNAGFEVVDEIARRLSCVLRRGWRFEAAAGRAAFAGENLLLLKPLSYMNCSGPVVAAVLRRRAVAVADMIVAVDDADLPVGSLRIRKRGGSGGHRGLSSIIEATGTEDFPRVRVGVGRSAGGGTLVDHVLRPFSGGERKRVSEVIGAAADAVLCMLESGVDAAMNRFNGPVKEPAGTGA